MKVYWKEVVGVPVVVGVPMVLVFVVVESSAESWALVILVDACGDTSLGQGG
jgi:hypothetical protein